MFHDLPHWAFKLLGSLLGAAVLFLLLSLRQYSPPPPMRATSWRLPTPPLSPRLTGT